MDLIKSKDLLNYNYPDYIKGIIIIIITLIIAFIVKNRINNIKLNIRKEDSIENNIIMMLAVSNIVYWGIIGLGVIISLKYFGIDISSILVVLGTAGLALGLAMQNTLTEIISGIMILLLNYYDIGDLVSIQIGSDNIFGKIDNFNLFTTIIKDSDRVVHRVPNTSIVKCHLINYYKNKEVSIGFDISISNNNNNIDINTTIDSLKTVIETQLENYVTDNSLINILISNMSSSGTQIHIRIPIESINYLPGRDEAKRVIRDFCAKNSLLLLDNFYKEGKTSYYS
jgi:small-conductance mechanosensitive channel